ncbi:MAG: hypothetical protein OXL97_09510 [Chloroflexota bacterium]|nr:hypothetical protein [Chloroflexota bacterium]MDE2885555.1 hypothetical protein [Chloroflexota bacterium]
MAVQITIRNVSEEVRNQLASRAALKHQSMQQFLLEELERIASEPSQEALFDRIRARVDASGRGVSRETILAALDADKRYDRR